LERHPRVAFTISPGSSYYKSAGIIHFQQLPPAPQRKVFAISFFAFFELFRRLPVVFLTKLLLVRYVTAVGKKPPHFGEVRTPMLQGLAEEPTCREGGPKPTMSSRIRTENFPALDVVKLRKYFRNQIIHQLATMFRLILLVNCEVTAIAATCLFASARRHSIFECWTNRTECRIPSRLRGPRKLPLSRSTSWRKIYPFLQGGCESH